MHSVTQSDRVRMRKLRQGLNNLSRHKAGQGAEAGSELGSVWPQADVIPCLLRAVPSPCRKPGNTPPLASRALAQQDLPFEPAGSDTVGKTHSVIVSYSVRPSSAVASYPVWAAA